MKCFLASSTDWSRAFQPEDPEDVCPGCMHQCDQQHNWCNGYIHTWKACVKETGDKVWFDDHCTCAATKKRRLFRKLKKMNTKANKDKFTKARKEFNHTEKIAKRRYNNKLKRELSDSNLSSKKSGNTVNTLSGKFTWADIPVLKDEHQTFTLANEKAEKFCQTFATE